MGEPRNFVQTDKFYQALAARGKYFSSGNGFSGDIAGRFQSHAKKTSLIDAKHFELRNRIGTIASNRQLSVSKLLVDHAVNGLKRKLPQFSAAKVITRSQALFLFAIVFFLAGLLLWNRQLGIAVGGLVLTVFYLGCVGLRLAILYGYKAVEQPSRTRMMELLKNPARCGTYSILVALYHEGRQARALVNALSRLEWPEGQKEVLLVCEEDDDETTSQLERIDMPGYFRIIKVPAAMPRTKPKALNHALPMASGDFLVIYDAEDRPHHLQLLEARLAFEDDERISHGKRLACLQAPLLIHNQASSWLTRLFSIEYTTLFLGMLPTLASWQAPLPLGGTSNHFKTRLLRRAGGWDPYNVTEDADLGIRLYRAGYVSKTITLPTMEEAPETLSNWIPQRTRWMKGWMQTILVHLRSPAECFHQLGTCGSFVFLFMLLAIVVSALIHPFFLAIGLLYLPSKLAGQSGIVDVLFAMTCLFNLAGAYLGYILLALRINKHRSHKTSNMWLVLLPAYWLMISYATWRALFQLVSNPYLWEKTEHVLAD